MSSIKKHQCPSCGGSLTVDNDRQMYRCSFCGSTYDYEYFREEQMHQMGETFLSRSEFKAAVDAYRFILKKDPHDFSALRGLMLAAASLENIDKLTCEDHGSGFWYNPHLVSEAIKGASEEDQQYFKDLEKIYSDMKELSKCNAEMEDLRKDKKKIEDAIRVREDSRERCNLVSRNGTELPPKPVFVLLWIVDGIFALLILILVVSLLIKGNGDIALPVGLVFSTWILPITLLNLLLVYPKVRRLNQIDASIRELYDEESHIDKKRRILDQEAGKLTDIIKNSVHDFLNKDKLKMSGDKT